jgi:hypothetical protein
MTTVNVTTQANTVSVTAAGQSTVVDVPKTSVVTATTAGPQGADGSQGPRSMTITNPIGGDNFTLFKPNVETTISTATAIVSNGSVKFRLRFDSNREANGTIATATLIVTNTTNGQDASIQSQPIPANSWVWVEIIEVVGSVNEFSVNLIF